MVLQKSHIFRKQQRFAPLIIADLHTQGAIMEHSQFAINLVCALPVRVRLTGYLLLKTLLRFGDLYNIDVANMAITGKYSLYQNKTGKYVVNDVSIRIPELAASLASIEDIAPFLEYQPLANHIQKFLRRYYQFSDITFKHLAHIFRHSEATMLALRNVPLSFIAARLGDSEHVVQKNYIHLDFDFPDL